MGSKKRESRFKENIIPCGDWSAIRDQFDSLPFPALRGDEEGETYREGWIFRGHSHERYRLEPCIEREHPFRDWAEVEYKSLREFQAKARMHMDPAQLPEPDDKLGWLAIMQHYGAPTRLLDFTYSPYVALYFALRNRKKDQSAYAEVWGLNAVLLRQQAANTSQSADSDEEVRRQEEVPPREFHRVSSAMEDARSSLQGAQEENEYWDKSILKALNPCGARREYFNREGFVAEASPSSHNPRLSGQQGVFLFNGAESSRFEESLDLMMDGLESRWYKRFRVPEDVLHDVEKRLFQLNVHDLSLFPDTEGLAGFVRQKIRLHW